MRRLAVAIAILLVSPPLAADVFALKAARMIDGTGAAPITSAVVIVTGDTITAVGAEAFHDLARRQAINEGLVRGPRMQAAAHALGITGGHCDENGYRPGLLDAGPREGIANGRDEVRTAVSYQVK